MKNAFTLHGAIYSRFTRDVFPQGTASDVMMGAIARLVGEQADRLINQTGIAIEQHLMTSTALAAPFNKGDLRWSDASSMFADVCRHPPRSLLNSYECSGWGYVLRYLDRITDGNRMVLVSIFDANIYEWDYWKVHYEWGTSGFGLGTLLIELADTPDALKVSNARSSNPIAEFAIEIRKQLQSNPDLIGALPFFPLVTQGIFNNTLKQFPRLPDLYEQWGHCFGSDPWLSIVLSRINGNPFGDVKRFLACSLAFSGYFSLAKVNVADNAYLEFVPSANDVMEAYES